MNASHLPVSATPFARARADRRSAAWHEAARGAWTTLLVTQMLLALAAIAGGAGLLLTNGLGIPASALETGPFNSFLWPGVLLLIVIGGTQLMAVILQLRGSVYYLAAAAIAGMGLLIWIFTQVMILTEYSLLQPSIFAAAVLQLSLTLLCLGILPREQRR